MGWAVGIAFVALVSVQTLVISRLVTALQRQAYLLRQHSLHLRALNSLDHLRNDRITFLETRRKYPPQCASVIPLPLRRHSGNGRSGERRG